MTQPIAARDVIERLGRLQAAGNLPKMAQKTATTLVSRLSSPVRVTLLGPAGAGKSTLRDVLAGNAIMPVGQKLPTTMLRFGDRESITVTSGDRSVRTIEGLDFSALRKISPAFVEVQAPLKNLEAISLLEIVTNGSRGELSAALKWAATRTDIAIWVTTEFGAEEGTIWAKMPDDLKDHAYLVLNKIDLLGPEEREAQNARLQTIAAQTFRSCFAISAASAQAAQGKGEAAIEIGCVNFLKSLKRHVDLAGQADLDSALMFLSRFEESVKTANRAEVKPPTTQRSQTAKNSRSASDTKSTGPDLQVENIANRGPERDGALQREARQAALDRIRNCANGLLSDWSILSGNIAEAILDRCVEAAEELSATFSPDDQFYEPTQQASDLIVLLHLEKSDAAAENAVTTLLQLKRDFEVALAA